MGEQLSLKAAMPLAEILATCRKNVSNTGPCTAGHIQRAFHTNDPKLRILSLIRKGRQDYCPGRHLKH